jgi:biotin carboxyl carrier protein
MKMDNDLQAERDGKVKEVKVEKGDSVLEGAVIIILE